MSLFSQREEQFAQKPFGYAQSDAHVRFIKDALHRRCVFWRTEEISPVAGSETIKHQTDYETGFITQTLRRRTARPLQRRKSTCQSAAENGQRRFARGTETGVRGSSRPNQGTRRAARRDLQTPR